jgi:hypothetical protein
MRPKYDFAMITAALILSATPCWADEYSDAAARIDASIAYGMALGAECTVKSIADLQKKGVEDIYGNMLLAPVLKCVEDRRKEDGTDPESLIKLLQPRVEL